MVLRWARLRLELWHLAYRLTSRSARVSWWCIERMSDAEADEWRANVEAAR